MTRGWRAGTTRLGPPPRGLRIPHRRPPLQPAGCPRTDPASLGAASPTPPCGRPRTECPRARPRMGRGDV